MPRFCANLSMLFTELPFLDRFEAAARAGFVGVECMFPYEAPANDIAERLQANALTLQLFNLAPGDWAAGERGIAALPERVSEFRDSVQLGLEYARALRCAKVHCLAGIATGETARRTYIDNLRYAAETLAPHDIEVLIEPINTHDIPGYFLTGTAPAIAVMQDVRASNLRLQFDCYHMQIMREDLGATIERLLPAIGHIQVADTPGRHEPGTGEINYPFIFEHLDRIGYTGWVGCEYRPRAATQDGLGWVAHYLSS